MKVLVFTDLDGTLLNQDDYSFREALPAIELLRRLDIPLILVSSKTYHEMSALRKELGNSYPFVCENGGIIIIPLRTFKDINIVQGGFETVDGCRHYRRGESRENILKALQALRPAYCFFGFSDLSTKEIAAHTGLNLAAAEQAGKRAASEPIVWQDTEEKLSEFSTRLLDHNLQVVKGGRFYHVMGDCDKGGAVRLLLELYRRHYGEPVYSIALGDSPNDLDMLKNVNLPVVVPRNNGEHLRDSALNGAVFAPYPGARGWNDAIIRIMNRVMNNGMENRED